MGGPALSRSHPLLGSYPLSLIHSRMSHAHQPHSSTTTFSLHIKAVGQGKRCPAELRCPKALDLPFPATYYDLEDPSGGATSAVLGAGMSQTPWVGTVDLEQYFYDQYSSGPSAPAASTSTSNAAEPPGHPGYHVAPVGQLQMIVKTPSNAIKAFLVPYDLRNLPVGGRLLARERTYVDITPSTPLLDPPSGVEVGEDANAKGKGKKKESLRYAYQLQFVCLPVPSEPGADAGGETTRQTTLADAEGTAERAYYLSKTLKVVFASHPQEADEVPRTRTERTDEIVPSSVGIRVSNTVKQRRRSSAGAAGAAVEWWQAPSPGRTMEDWQMVRTKWLARRDMHHDGAVVEEEPPSRAHTPIPVPQPFDLPSQSHRAKPPPSPRFARRQLRRTSAEERELSEKLRQLGVGIETSA